MLAAVDINISAKRKVKAGEAMPIDHRSGKENEDKKGGKWQPNRKLRQDSRRIYQNGLQRSMWSYKTVTGDDVFVAARHIDQSKPLRAWSTDMAWSGPMLGRQPPQADSPAPTSAAAVDQMEVDDEPNVFDLARASPTKFRSHKSSAREEREKRDRFCSKCRVKHESVLDTKIDSPWLGCDGTDGGKDCTYWVHACCIGFTNARVEDFSEEKRFYCDEHNRVRQTIEQWKEAQKVSSKRRINRKR